MKFKTPHAPLRSPDFSAPIGYNCKRKAGNSPFYSRSRKSIMDADAPEKMKDNKPPRLIKEVVKQPFKVTIKNGEVIHQDGKFCKRFSAKVLGLNQDGIYEV